MPAGGRVVGAERTDDESGWLGDAVRGAAVALWSWDLASDTLHHTARCGELLGLAVGTLPTARAAVEALLHSEDRARHDVALRAHLDGRAPYELEVRLRHPDLGWRWIALRGAVVRDEAGRPLRLAGSAADVTEQRATESTLHERQAHLALLFAQATVGLSEIAADGRFLRANAELCRIVGRPLDTVATLAVPDVTHPDDVARSLAAVGGVLEHGGSVRLEKRYVRPDGTAVVAESVVTRLDPLPGAEPTLLAVTTDLTAWRAAEAALRESETRFRQLAENVSEMFWLVDLGPTLDESRIIYMNPAYVRITGRSLDEGHAAPILELDQIASDDRPRVLEAAHAVMRGAPEVVEYRLRTAEDAERVVRTRMFPVRDREDRVTRIAGLTEDVTEQRALEDRLRQAQKMEAVGQLAGGVAHDFNNLLTVISANLEFVQGDLPGELAADHPVWGDLAEIAHAAERARDLVRQLLAFSRKQPMRLQPVRLATLVRHAEGLLRRTLGEEIALEVQVLDDPTVRADAGQLEQVLLNLAVNGRDAMLNARRGHPGTGGTLTITVDLAPAPVPVSVPAALPAAAPASDPEVARRSPGAAGPAPRSWARVRVRDTGHGMDAATQAHLFEPFFTTKEVGAGTGLGLASAHGIVTHAGGVIQVASAVGAGTTFTILLPLYDAPMPPTSEGTAPGGAAQPRGRGTVLLVEDEPAVRTSVRRVLERAGFVVREAAHGAAGLEVWATHRDAVVAVVTDVRMPVLGGRAMADRLHADAPELPVVFLSGYSDEGPAVVRAAHEAFVPKPFAPDALLATLGRLLR